MDLVELTARRAAWSPNVVWMAAGAVEAIFTAMALVEGYLPATIGYQVPDPACDLDIVPNQGRKADIKAALSNSLGFGGHNACIVLKKWEGRTWN